MMKMEIIEERENPLLKRREVFLKVKHEGATPKRKEAKELLMKEIRSNENLIVIDKMKTMFGKSETEVYAKVYESENRLKEIEHEHIIRRNFSNGSA